MSKQEKNDHNSLSLKTKIVMLVGTPLIVIIICSVVIYYAAQSIVENEVFTDAPEIVEYEGTDTAQNAVPVLENLFNEAVNSGTVKYHHTENVRISDVAVGNDESNAPLRNIIDYISGSISDGINGKLYTETNVDYGKKITVSGNTAFRAEGCEYSTEQPEEEGMLDVIFDTEKPSEKVAAAFADDMTDADSILDEYKDVFDIVSKYSELASLHQTARINAEKGQIVNARSERKYNVRLKVKFKGSFEELGTQLISFTYTVNENHEFTFAGIKIEQKELRIHKSGYENLTITANVSSEAAPEDFKLTYKTTAASIASVDENGMVEAQGKESADPVKITATLEYLGNTYEDDILVYVIEEADSVTIAPHTASVKKGETVQLTANVKPKDATIKTVKWISEDESIATVDANGLVTGTGTGTVQIVAITDDGGLMTGCSVTVKE